MKSQRHAERLLRMPSAADARGAAARAREGARRRTASDRIRGFGSLASCRRAGKLTTVVVLP